MKMKKITWILLVVIILCMVIVWFISTRDKKKEEIQMVELETFFYKEYYQPEKKHREEEITLEEACKEVVIQGSTTSGTIHVVFENKDQEDIKYEYIVDGSLSETVKIDKNHIKDQWMLSTDINEETEGSLRLLFH